MLALEEHAVDAPRALADAVDGRARRDRRDPGAAARRRGSRSSRRRSLASASLLDARGVDGDARRLGVTSTSAVALDPRAVAALLGARPRSSSLVARVDARASCSTPPSPVACSSRSGGTTARVVTLPSSAIACSSSRGDAGAPLDFFRLLTCRRSVGIRSHAATPFACGSCACSRACASAAASASASALACASPSPRRSRSRRARRRRSPAR